ncbi:hypothetical protein ND748_07700 [Frankia sp. AiPs1]|uniref:hypothetical protein n=1 Tax=Frankia sp. AiPs1 TaxID=573493 RepID=UPI0020446B7C|nr:hypothetical protein [Frankia sp. AiPs1]MCM3921549.1 hypothetical protein [Frankia sp. AiPs1]
MDDRQRLLRLVSLVAWAGEPGSNSCGLRFANGDDELWWNGSGTEWAEMAERGEEPPVPHGDAHTALWALESWFAGAVGGLTNPARYNIEVREFPGVAYQAVAGLPDEVLAMLGRMIKCWLHLPLDVDVVEVARRWAEDVRATAWRTLVGEYDDHYDRSIPPSLRPGWALRDARGQWLSEDCRRRSPTGAD